MSTPSTNFSGSPRPGAFSVVALLLCLTLLFPSPAAGFGEFTISDEAELGRKFNALIQARYTLIDDPEIVGYVQEMATRLTAVMPPQPFPIKVNVLELPGLNAFATPAGYVYIHTGLILGVDHDSELAGVLAHELAHVSQRHIAENVERSKLISLGALLGLLAGAFLGQGEAGSALAMGSVAGAQSMMLKYSRENEEEADQVGIQYLVRAGYSPRGLVGAFRKIRKNQWLQQGSMPSYLSTHPGVDERIGYLEDRIETLPASILLRNDTNGKFQRVQTLLRARFRDPSTALAHFTRNPEAMSCLDHLGRAMCLDRLNRAQEAGREYEQALDCAGDDPLWLREAGRFYFQTGDFQRAAGLLQKAAVKSPKDFMTLYYLARLQASTGDLDAAEATMRRVLSLNARNAEAHYHLGRILGERNRLFGAYLHLAYAAIYDNEKKQARQHVARAESLARSAEDKALFDELHEVYTSRQEYWSGQDSS